ncbi:MAG: hypothetical protein A4E28_03090 [Methanocella sp. PtaU1.Bin125]|nr:MAG: hypothetical protein A4E28_03090 [Methanocella sp. PtaU1.Bin125]
MRKACPGVLLILVIMAAAALSGCTGSPASPAPGTGTPAAASPVPAHAPMRSGALFDTGRLQWFEYRLTGAGGEEPAVSEVRFDFTTTAVNGIAVKDDRITIKLATPEMLVVMDRYYDPGSHVQVGSRVRTESAGASLSDLGLQAGDLYRMGNIVDACATGNWPLKSLGTETVTVDGTSHVCTKYAVGEAGEHGVAWVSTGVPVPVKIESVSDDGRKTTWELTGRG